MIKKSGRLVTAGLTVVMLSACAGSARIEREASASHLTVYKTPTCVCCDGWIRHVEAESFTTEVISLADLAPVKEELGVPRHLSSCHTSTIGSYVVEGHVPAEAIRKLLREAPEARGLVLPGMPPGSPGMPGPQTPYSVLLLDAQGAVDVYHQQ